eukprot:4332067-Pleurochrysis_carterae.AAC.1
MASALLASGNQVECSWVPSDVCSGNPRQLCVLDVECASASATNPTQKAWMALAGCGAGGSQACRYCGMS